MNINIVTEAEIFSWIEKTIDKDIFKNYEVSLNGKSEKGDGYVGEIVFVCVTGTTNENKQKTLHLVIKHGKKNDHLRSTVPMKEAFDNEIHVYDKIFPFFKQFQFDKNIQDAFDSVPKCYNTLILNNMEVLVLDNIKERGYELHDRKIPFNMSHVKTVLKEYGKLHALSFALKDQRAKEFNELADFSNDVMISFLRAESSKDFSKISFDKALNMLKDRNEIYLLEKLKKIVPKDPKDIMWELLTEKESQSVVIHGDSWNNNFLFKYQNADKTTPTNVVILDWQISALRSPATDLSYLIYSTCSTDELDKFDELLKFYYASFSSFLTELGSDPEQLFPYSSLKLHWRKYSLAGLIMSLVVLPMILCDKDDAPAFENLKEDEKFTDIIFTNIKGTDLYFERVKSIVAHYIEYTYK